VKGTCKKAREKRGFLKTESGCIHRTEKKRVEVRVKETNIRQTQRSCTIKKRLVAKTKRSGQGENEKKKKTHRTAGDL